MKIRGRVDSTWRSCGPRFNTERLHEKKGVEMKKIPTLFMRDFDNDPSRVLNEVHPECQWVLDGEGVATIKLDGTAVMFRNFQPYKRRGVKKGQEPPFGFELVEKEETTGKSVGWVPVGEGPEDKWHREAFTEPNYVDGTYELIGPKIQGNPEQETCHLLVPHHSPGLILANSVPRSYDELKAWLQGKDCEGIVFHHPDGRMAKVKLKDFGFKREKLTDDAVVKMFAESRNEDDAEKA